jgi:hypothetical protein
MDTAGTEFEDLDGRRTWALTAQGWKAVKDACDGASAVAIQSSRSGRVLAMAWNRAEGVSGIPTPAVTLESSAIVNKRIHVRGKIYLMDAHLDVLADRIRKELNINE